jgi:hypothetical protein
LPNNSEGQLACHLLTKAFACGWLFVVSDSVTTGATNVVVWGGIHQKTSPTGGETSHGWPDAGYITRLQMECAAVGVFTDEQGMELDRLAARQRLVDRRVGSADGVGTNGVGGEWVIVGDTEASGAHSVNIELEAKVVVISQAIKAAMAARDGATLRTLMAARAVATANLTKGRSGAAGGGGGGDGTSVAPNPVAATSA